MPELPDEYFGPESHKEPIRRWMRQFGSHPILAYPDTGSLRTDFTTAGFQLKVESDTMTVIYEENNQYVGLQTLDFIAKKKR